MLNVRCAVTILPNLPAVASYRWFADFLREGFATACVRCRSWTPQPDMVRASNSRQRAQRHLDASILGTVGMVCPCHSTTVFRPRQGLISFASFVGAIDLDVNRRIAAAFTMARHPGGAVGPGS